MVFYQPLLKQPVDHSSIVYFLVTMTKSNSNANLLSRRILTLFLRKFIAYPKRHVFVIFVFLSGPLVH